MAEVPKLNILGLHLGRIGMDGKLLHELGIVSVRTVLLYAVALTVLRLSGKRTLGKLDTFDFVVMITIGSTVVSLFVITGRAVEAFPGAALSGV
jgi:uncharacterized membrane protein YcaP (DUF421 family)